MVITMEGRAISEACSADIKSLGFDMYSLTPVRSYLPRNPVEHGQRQFAFDAAHANVSTECLDVAVGAMTSGLLPIGVGLSGIAILSSPVASHSSSSDRPAGERSLAARRRDHSRASRHMGGTDEHDRQVSRTMSANTTEDERHVETILICGWIRQETGRHTAPAWAGARRGNIRSS